ncbi:hypothetical protein N3930_41615, partial [Bacillus thuringiensis]|nr:hypothetical protein [Bacillus thuringiensis]
LSFMGTHIISGTAKVIVVGIVNKLDYNHYYGEFDQTNGLWQWKRKMYKGFSSYQAGMNQEGNEQHSVFSKLPSSFKLIQ